jgi:hypothetical protein
MRNLVEGQSQEIDGDADTPKCVKMFCVQLGLHNAKPQELRLLTIRERLVRLFVGAA